MGPKDLCFEQIPVSCVYALLFNISFLLLTLSFVLFLAPLGVKLDCLFDIFLVS